MTFLMPPFSKNDEMAHFYRAFSVAQGQIFCKTDEKFSFTIPRSYYELPYFLHSDDILFDISKKFPKSIYVADFSNLSKENETIYFGLCHLNFLGYFPNVLGILVGLAINNMLVVYFLGRITAFIFFLGCLFFSLKIIPKHYRLVVMFYASIPMVVHQVTVFSYDVMVISLAPVLFALLLKILVDKKLNRSLFIVFLIALALFTLPKPGYNFFLLLYFLIPWKYINKSFVKYLVITIISLGLIGLCTWFLLSKSPIHPRYFMPLVDDQIHMKILMSDPLLFIKIVFNSMVQNSNFYFRGMIGIFGVNDTYPISDFLYFIYTMGFGIVFYQLVKDSKNMILVGWKSLFVLLFILISTFFAIFLALYFNWTVITSMSVGGVQGRYFLVLLPLLFWFLENLVFLIKRYRWTKIFIVFLLAIAVLANITYSIYKRYYDYSRTISNGNEMNEVLANNSTKKTVVKESILVDKPVEFLVDAKTPGYKIGGISFLFENQGKLVNIPYFYELKDTDCVNVIKSGFLDQNQLQNEGVYNLFFNEVVRVNSDKFCINIKPFATKGNLSNYINLVSYDGQKAINLLYITK